MNSKSKLKSNPIYIQSLTALLLIHLTHKIVREIPGALEFSKSGAIAVSISAGLILLSIVLILFKNKTGVYIGLLAALYMIFQPIYVHIIHAVPDQNGVWWYPVFPWLQAILIIYFSILLLRNESKSASKQKPMSKVAFTVMTIMMNLRKNLRNIDSEVNYAGVKEGHFVLDYGCGLGFNTIPAAEIAGHKGRVYALDIDPKAINIVKKKAKKRGLENVEIMPSGSSIKLDSKTIDIVYLHNVLPMIKDKNTALNEITRVLKQGGLLSYMSGMNSRVYGDDTISNSQLKELLKSDFKLDKENKGHLIFKKV